LTYNIRRMVEEDLIQVNEIDREAFPTQWPPANYKQELQNRIAHYIVTCDIHRKVTFPPAEKKNGDLIARLMPWRKEHTAVLPPEPVPQLYIAGFCGIWMLAGEAHITNIAVRQEYRGLGLGEYLLIAIYDVARNLEASFMTLECRASNIVAQGLYNKYGFMEMGIRKGYYLDNREDAVIMSTESISLESYQSHIENLREVLTKKLPQQQS
jgi:[ribosomal protein S18]-alanine N-acetyltransferase